MAAPAVPSPPVSSGTPAQAIPADPAKPMRPGKVLANQVNSLSPSELQEAITSLKTHYFKAGTLSEEELQRALLTGILLRIAPGASLIAKDHAAGDESLASAPFKMEILKENIGYVRMGSLTAANLAELDTALKGFVGGPVGSLVLDLRATPESNDFQLAAELLGRFCPKGMPLFTIKKNASAPAADVSRQEPAFTGPLMVLVSRENTGASEVVAAVLRLDAKAIVIGEQTRGAGVEYEEFKLGANQALRVAIAEIALPEGPSIFPEGVAPDLAVPATPESRRKVLAKELESGVAPLIFETERPRMNEASLVAGTNPEMDAYQSAQKTGAEKGSAETTLRDTVLQRAVDLIATIKIYGNNRP